MGPGVPQTDFPAAGVRIPREGRESCTLRQRRKPAIFARMHFSRHISQLHSTFSLLAALKLRLAR